MNKLTIMHYLPVSFYPPAMNLVDMIEDKVDVQLISTLPDKGKLNYRSQKTEINNPVCCNDKDGSFLRLFKYEWYVLSCLLKLISRKPDAVMYYESISALPVYLYKRYFNRKVKVYIHYHEYSSEEDYLEPGRRLFAWNHQIERKWIYEHAEWISQTNLQRLNMYLHDNPMKDRSKAHVFPNYPPKLWWRKEKRHEGDVCRCVYVGSLSLQDTFVKEFCEWVKLQDGRVAFDMFSFNFRQDTMDTVNALDCPYIHFHKEGVAYSEIPKLLDGYDAGILLYKATSVNFQWNETNKFYEYLICGLDVWYPKEMLLLHELDKSQYAPEVKEMDFDNIDSFDGTVKQGIVDNSTYHWFADEVYNEFINQL